MTTRTREGRGGGGGGGGDDKRDSSSSTSNQPKKSTSVVVPPKPNPPSQKPLPNYLKPTISSSGGGSGGGLDPSSSIAATIRRRSLYKPPPSTSHFQKSLPHASTTTLRPKSSASATRTPLASTRPVPMRSFSSLSSSSTKSPMGPTMRGSISAKVSPANSSSSVRRVVRRAGPSSITSESSVEFDPRDKDRSDQVIDQEEKLDGPATVEHESVLDIETKDENVIVPKEIEEEQETKPCEKEEHLVGTEEVRNMNKRKEEIKIEHHDKKEHLVVTEEEMSIGKSDIGIKIGHHGKEEHLSVAKDERSIEKSDEETKTGQSEIKEHLVITKEEKNTDKSIEVIKIVDGVSQGIREEVKDTKEDLTKVDEKHVVVELEGSVNGGKVGEGTSVQVLQVKSMSHATVKADRHAKQTQPKKKEKQAYNDVIEETASKLMDNKRNKVRALAGAFETVISLQDTK